MGVALSTTADWLGLISLLLAVIAIGYTVHAIFAVRGFGRLPLPPAASPEPISLLKPLHGLEPRLADNLASFLDQDWPASLQMVAGSNAASDPALTIARALPNVIVVAGAPVLGANAKIANVANLARAATHDLLILSDSDMAVPPDYVARVAAALAQPGVGAATCLYHGRGDAGFWSRFAAAAISYQFIPSVMTSLALKVEHPCMGSTIALRRETLERIGGFEAFADVLADDHAIGAALRRLGLTVVPVPQLMLAHGCGEASLAALWRHELRWAATLRAVSAPAHAGVLLTHPLPLALLATALRPCSGALAVAVALVARLLLARAVDRVAGARTAPLWQLPARDLLSFAVFLASFGVRSVDWRGVRLRMEAQGRVSAEP